jgi:hypothetical protein
MVTVDKKLTNEAMNRLLLELGFEQGQVTEKNLRIWQHPESECTLLLPANKTTEAVRPADMVGIRAQLDFQGHLDAEDFDFFVSEGRLPTPSQ